jgi:hypothetical protein
LERWSPFGRCLASKPRRWNRSSVLPRGTIPDDARWNQLLCASVRYTEANFAVAEREPAFGLEAPARRTSRVRILLRSKSESGLHIVCNFGGQALFRTSVLDSNGRENSSLNQTWTGAYNGRRPRHGKQQVPGWNPRPSKTSKRRNFNKIATCDESQVALSGGGGNCTRSPVSVSICAKSGYDMASDGRPEMGREEEALRELVANWHRLAPSVRDAIMALVRSCEM